MPSDDRPDAIRAAIAAEREELARALADLRRDLNAKRSQGAAVAASLAAGVAAIAAVKVLRRLRGD